MKKFILLLLFLNIFINAQPSVVIKKIIDLNQPKAIVHKIKKINSLDYGTVGEIILDGGHRDMFFAKFNLDSLIFSKNYHSEGSLGAQDFELANDSSFIIVGNNVLLKINNQGDIVWSKIIDRGTISSILYSITRIDNNNYIACGYFIEWVSSFRYASIWLVKFNELGDIFWDKKYHKQGSYEPDYGLKVKRTIDDNIVITGTNGGQIYVLKTDLNGNEVFFNHYSNYGIIHGLLRSNYISEGLDSSYYITGTIPVLHYFEDILLIKTDKSGDTLFVKNYNGNPLDGNPNFSDEYGVYIKILNSNNILLGGNGRDLNSNDNLQIILSLDSNGNIIWKHIIEIQNYSRLLLIEESNDNKLLYLGVEDFLPHKIFIITTSYEVTNITSINSVPIENLLNQNYPNPFNPTTKIKYQIQELSLVTIKVYDVLGSEVAILVNEEKPVGSYEVEFNATSLPSGIYFYRLQAGFFVETKKMVLMK